MLAEATLLDDIVFWLNTSASSLGSTTLLIFSVVNSAMSRLTSGIQCD